MLQVKFLKGSFDFLFVESFATIAGNFLFSSSYFELNSVVIDSTNNPHHLVKKLGQF